jgi:hypothetical protein
MQQEHINVISAKTSQAAVKLLLEIAGIEALLLRLYPLRGHLSPRPGKMRENRSQKGLSHPNDLLKWSDVQTGLGAQH